MYQLHEDLTNAPQNVGETFDAIKDQYDPWKPFFESVLEKHVPKMKKVWTERCTIQDRRMENGRQEQKEICAIVCPKLNFRELGV